MADRKKSLDPVVLYRVEMPKIAAASAGTDGKRSTFVCNIGALSSSERARYGALGKKLLASRQAVKELANGYAFQFPSDSETIQSAAEWITMERKCCPFFGFDL
ncbi:MAG TPA: hypothetical protein VEZ90_08300, partial [Blastocatellia bacterium]|nr:hypothetical protein [Blastocatellia bacterium]